MIKKARPLPDLGKEAGHVRGPGLSEHAGSFCSWVHDEAKEGDSDETENGKEPQQENGALATTWRVLSVYISPHLTQSQKRLTNRVLRKVIVCPESVHVDDGLLTNGSCSARLLRRVYKGSVSTGLYLETQTQSDERSHECFGFYYTGCFYPQLINRNWFELDDETLA
ncbi:hypothetical protein Q8A73_019433 [Channa argus]|nr:hypothetical protein Q8A73_019433 [Channa argus]